MDVNHQVGKKISAIRSSRNLTPAQLAERCSIPVAVINGIESGEVFPSLSPLLKIARGLGVRLGTFLDDDDNVGPVLTKSGQASQTVRISENSDSGLLNFFSLAKNKTGRHMEPFYIQVQPLNEAEFVTSSHEGEEFIYVLEGSIELFYGHEHYQLKSGDSIYYDSIVQHHLHSADKEPAAILAVVFAP